MTVPGTMVTGTLLAATEFLDFFCVYYDVTHHNLQENAVVALSPLIYDTYLAVAMAASSSHVTMKCVTISYTSQNKPHPLPAYVANSSSTRATVDQRRRNVRGGASWRQEVTSSS